MVRIPNLITIIATILPTIGGEVTSDSLLVLMVKKKKQHDLSLFISKFPYNQGFHFTFFQQYVIYITTKATKIVLTRNEILNKFLSCWPQVKIINKNDYTYKHKWIFFHSWTFDNALVDRSTGLISLALVNGDGDLADSRSFWQFEASSLQRLKNSWDKAFELIMLAINIGGRRVQTQFILTLSSSYWK